MDAFVAEMMAKHPELKAMKEELSFWQKDPRAKLLGEWVCEDLLSVEFKITVEDNYFLLSICVTKWGECDYSTILSIREKLTGCIISSVKVKS